MSSHQTASPFDQSAEHAVETQNRAPRSRAAVIRSFPNRVLKITVFSSCKYSRQCAHFHMPAVPSPRLEQAHKRTASELSDSDTHSEPFEDGVESAVSAPPHSPLVKRQRRSTSQDVSGQVDDVDFWSDIDACLEAVTR